MRHLILVLVLFTSCCQERLSVFTEMISYDALASYQVDTPDPCLACPDRGERLVISWNLPDPYEEAHIEARIRFKNLHEINFIFPLLEQRGHMTYNLFNQDYLSTGGILAYQIALFQGETLIEESTHALWTHLIRINE